MKWPAIIRFLKYVTVGGSTFAVDLLLLFLLIDIFNWNYLVATATAFITAVSINYSLSRTFVFRYSRRPAGTGYVFFLTIAGLGLLLILLGMYIMVDILSLNYIVSRVVIAGAVGCWNYLLNLHANFRVAGIH